MSKLIGRDSNQVPTNGLLGTMAFQDAAHYALAQGALFALPANDIGLSLNASYFTKTITANTTLTISSAGRTSRFTLVLTNGGAFTVTWFAGVKWAAGTPPTLTAAGKDSLEFYTNDFGVTWVCINFTKDFK